ncbi:phosphoribosyltransferase [Mesosutterella sp. OilRF-GAM-744-9]|uniref:Phosphoribosyltransferase n=2 Tax=Mesosutterella TaxID=2494213 RepID=A0ABS9MU96_9BURK|nr:MULTISPECIES: phosphoribosyltransferase family protein [unclassified Mesosutterella]MCG5031830.1 phosphoribosyltransferase [Mesosutterella sp. oilRF-744-WT-GAM-9]MCI6529884.1 phosphoribosyltransferase [Mesosutterella sp.]MDL2059245.1 phosphoribosyltransferase family protein [Mesosutterella sp. AGMB02718]
MADLFVSWQDYIDLNEQLVLKVADSGWEFDSLLCLARGGMRPGDIFSRVMSRPLNVLSTSSYRADAGRTQGELSISSRITGTGEIRGRLLLVDDMVDSGLTIRRVVESLKKNFPAVTEVRVAVLWWKERSAFRPDYYVSYLKGDPWIHQPFEMYDDLGVEKLREKRLGEAS